MTAGKPAQPPLSDETRRAFELDRTLTYRLHVLHKVSDRHSASAYLADAGLGMSEGRCLAAIGAFAPLSINDLAQRANLNKGQASRAAQTLVDRDLVSKKASATDARGVVLTLTRTGKKTWAKVVRVIERRNEQIFSCLSLEDRERLGAMFDRLIEHAAKRHMADDSAGDPLDDTVPSGRGP
jgi:DNA-binding MarR family transcriptional regulator